MAKFGEIGARIGPPANHPEPCRNAAKVFVSWLGGCPECGKIRDAPGKPVFSELASDFGGIRTRNSPGFRVGGAPPADPTKPARFASQVLVSWLGGCLGVGKIRETSQTLGFRRQTSLGQLRNPPRIPRNASFKVPPAGPAKLARVATPVLPLILKTTSKR